MAKKDGEGEVSIPRQNRRGRPSEGDLARLGEVRSLPDGPADAEGLTLRQRLILETIQGAVAERGYPPTIREMGEAVGLAKVRAFDGHPLAPISPTVIPPGHFYVQGMGPDSFDSRYAESGLVSAEQVLGVVVPIF